jgi:hypothetical protein
MVNKVYFGNIAKIKEVFEKEGVVSLFDIFEKKEYDILKKKLKALKFVHELQLTSHSYASTIVNGFFDSSFTDLIHKITSKKLNTTTAYKLRWKDYEILHDDKKQNVGVEIIIDFTDDWPENAGGSIVYKEDEVTLEPKGNSITIINKTGQRFFQYVNHYGKERLFILGSLEGNN